MTAIEVGQLIFIPNRRTTQEVIPAKYSSDDFIWPIRGRIIAGFGKTYNNMINKGLNIQPHSNLDVIASRSGRVVFYADAFGSFGKTIIIEHGDGLSTVYARNEQVFIKAGQNVEKGAMIARVGSAGRDRNTYLHFEIRKGHIPQNPYFYLP
jgi:murein DD-endopeptidase MepM/ murein hydrolase activator NlpD